MTNSIGHSNTMVAVAIPDKAERMFPDVVRGCGEPNRSELIRRAVAFYARAKMGAKAVAFEAAILTRETAKSVRQHPLAALFCLAIPFASTQPNFEARRQRFVSRSVVHAVRRQEVGA